MRMMRGFFFSPLKSADFTGSFRKDLHSNVIFTTQIVQKAVIIQAKESTVHVSEPRQNNPSSISDVM